MKFWQDEQGISIDDANKEKGLRVYKYTPTWGKDAGTRIGLRRYRKDEHGKLKQEYHTVMMKGKKVKQPYFCPILMHQVPAVIKALQELMDKAGIKEYEDKEMRRYMR